MKDNPNQQDACDYQPCNVFSDREVKGSDFVPVAVCFNYLTRVFRAFGSNLQTFVRSVSVVKAA